jgi:hypothetical protein
VGSACPGRGERSGLHGKSGLNGEAAWVASVLEWTRRKGVHGKSSFSLSRGPEG